MVFQIQLILVNFHHLNMSFNSLILGRKYSKKDLSEIFNNPNISIIREGIFDYRFIEGDLKFVERFKIE